jgi:hypothetical protein
LVAERLIRHERILAHLPENQRFVSAMAQAVPVALQTTHEGKLRALRNAVVHAALDDTPDEEESRLFIRYIDELLPSHSLLLAAMDRHANAIAGADQMPELVRVLQNDLPASLATADAFQFACQELESRFLIRLAPGVQGYPDVATSHIVSVAPENHGKPHVRVTELGRSFLRYLEEEPTVAKSD